MLGVAVLVIGRRAPRASGSCGRTSRTWASSGCSAQLLPDGSDVLSPFTYTPQLPAEAMDWPPVLAVLGVVAVGLIWRTGSPHSGVVTSWRLSSRR